MVGDMRIAQRVEAEQEIRQTLGGHTVAALLALPCVPLFRDATSLRMHRTMDWNVGLSGQLPRSYGGIDASHSASSWVELVPNIERALVSELTNVFVQITQNQTELDGDAKRALYGNVRRLYRR